MATMRALVYDEGQGVLGLQVARPKPTPSAGEALIRVLRAGICSTVSVHASPSFSRAFGHQIYPFEHPES